MNGAREHLPGSTPMGVYGRGIKILFFLSQFERLADVVSNASNLRDAKKSARDDRPPFIPDTRAFHRTRENGFQTRTIRHPIEVIYDVFAERRSLGAGIDLPVRARHDRHLGKKKRCKRANWDEGTFRISPD